MAHIPSFSASPPRYLLLRRWFNIFDSLMILASFIVLGVSTRSGATLGAARMIRLLLRNLRLLTVIKSVPTLRAIVAGLTQVSDRKGGTT